MSHRWEGLDNLSKKCVITDTDEWETCIIGCLIPGGHFQKLDTKLNPFQNKVYSE